MRELSKCRLFSVARRIGNSRQRADGKDRGHSHRFKVASRASTDSPRRLFPRVPMASFTILGVAVLLTVINDRRVVAAELQSGDSWVRVVEDERAIKIETDKLEAV